VFTEVSQARYPHFHPHNDGGAETARNEILSRAARGSLPAPDRALSLKRIVLDQSPAR
jgi:hypothetical protein